MIENIFGDSVEVPSLLELCIQKIQDNLETIRDLGKINDKLLVIILDKCPPAQLTLIERRIGRVIDTEDLWRRHCFNTTFLDPAYTLDANSTWKQLYNVLEQQYEEKKKKTGENLRKIYDSAANSKKSKQIKVLNFNPSTIPAPQRSFSSGSKASHTGRSPVVNKTPSYAPKPGSQAAAYAGRKVPTISPSQPKLMAKVLKEFKKK
ncbi:hypothetical protein CYY_009659 [Polysphondylium violaceum]|uniref:Elongin-A n=1 Tax=Polysphondylium violaceum TaxID=133409 RepID=A0A8J4PLZ6_9MYCE|nr:hypothetical protein CYY_009659 [Polysphondylium violaceum]